ncbi:MAG: penicillin-binding protein 2 [Hyphomicrobiaceae bacterium]|nr:penicillin-binding protein 2 [Hyphomicrobiaceae bacterium]
MRRTATKPRATASVDEVSLRLRAIAVTGAVGLAFLAVGGQLVRLAAVNSGVTLQSNISETVAHSFSRPDLVDRNGRLFATDVENPSLFADPGVIIDRDEVVEKLTQVLPGLNARELRRDLSDRSKRFVWIKRQIAPNLAQKVHDLGLPGVSFRTELKRAYPLSRLAGHVLGAVNVDNKGVSGMERYLDDSGSVEAVHGATLSERAPVRLSIDIGVQHSLTEELQDATKRYKAEAATGVVMDVTTGEVLASASLPEPDPRSGSAADTQQTDRITGGTYELGSIFKMLTVAESLDEGVSTLDTIYDVRQPMVEGRFTIKDLHPMGRPASVRDIFLHSSNVGAAMIALKSGGDKQKAFLTKLGLLDQGRTEAGPIAQPQVPKRWERIEQITIAYGHGVAVAPLQFAAAAAALVNGGELVKPTFLRGRSEAKKTRVISADTSRQINELMRLNVTDPAGTGKRAEVPGYRVGGKTGTAEMAGVGGYEKKSVISSFVAAFPMEKPQYVVMVMLFKPQATDETKNEITAGHNAAPTAGRIIARVAPLLGVMPEPVQAAATGVPGQAN